MIRDSGPLYRLQPHPCGLAMHVAFFDLNLGAAFYGTLLYSHAAKGGFGFVWRP